MLRSNLGGAARMVLPGATSLGCPRLPAQPLVQRPALGGRQRCQGRARLQPPAAAADAPAAQPPRHGTGASAPNSIPQGLDAPDPEAASFSWPRQWYPLLPVSYLDRGRPSAVTVLGHSLAVWYHTPSGRWQAVEDRCPHRLAPLSEGRVDPATGNLACSYHGWQFAPGGRCAAIPQADSAEREAAALGSPRACVASYPVREEQGLLWVWMDSSPGAAAASAAAPLGLPAELQGGEGAPGALLGDWYSRDLPVSYSYLLENLLDPSHVHWAHHGVIGSRERAGPIQLEQLGELSTQGGFAVRMARTGMAGGVPAVTRFVPPSLAWLTFGSAASVGHPGSAPSFGSFSMLFYAVPVAPGRCRIIAGYSAAAVPPLLRQALAPSGPLAPLLHSLQFLGDLGSHEVIDGDTLFLYFQEQRASGNARRGGWGSSYFMPAGADTGVVLLRRWMEERSGGGPEYGPDAPAAAGPAGGGELLSREQILDRYHQHTKDCPHCSRALRNVRALKGSLSLATSSTFAAGFTLAAIQALLLPPPFAPRTGRAAALFFAGGLACGLLEQALAQLEERFVFTDYTHYDKD